MSVELSEIAQEAYRIGVMPYSEYLKIAKVKPEDYRNDRVTGFIKTLSGPPRSQVFLSGFVFPGYSTDEGRAFLEVERFGGLQDHLVARMSPFCDDVSFSIPILLPRRLKSKLQGYVSITGTLNVGFEYQLKYVWVEEAVQVHPPFRPVLDFNDMVKLLNERYSAERHFIEPIASLILSSPDIYSRMGGLGAILLPSLAAQHHSVYTIENLRAIHQDLLKLAPPQYRRDKARVSYVVDSTEFTAPIHQMDFALLDLMGTHRGAHVMARRPHLSGLREASMNSYGESISLADKLLAKVENPLPISPRTFEIDRQATNMLEFREVMFDSAVAHQWELSFLPEAPSFYGKRFHRWLDKQTQADLRRRYLIQQGRLLDPGLGGRYEHALRLACAYARGEGRHEVTEDDVGDSLRLQEKLLDIIVEAVPEKDWKELEDTEEAARSKRDGQFTRLLQDIISTHESEAPEDLVIEELMKSDYSSEYIARNLRFLIQHGYIYQPKPGFLGIVEQRFR